MIIQIPFSGFYYSIHDQQLDYELFNSVFTDYATGCHNNDNLSNHAFDAIDWRELHLDYAKNYADYFAHKFNLKLEFDSLSSPREYNFATDRIFCKIDDAEVMRIWRETKPETMINQVKSMFTSYDGFSSFYCNDFNDWNESPLEYDHNELYCLLCAWLADNENYYDDFEWRFIESNSCNGFFSELIYKHCSIANRLFKIHDYLNARYKRGLK